MTLNTSYPGITFSDAILELSNFIKFLEKKYPELIIEYCKKLFSDKYYKVIFNNRCFYICYSEDKHWCCYCISVRFNGVNLDLRFSSDYELLNAEELDEFIEAFKELESIL